MIQLINKMKRNIFGRNSGIWFFLVILVIGGCAGTHQSTQDEPLPPPENANPLVAQLIIDGNGLFAKRDFREAVWKYEAAINAQSASGEAHYNLGLALTKRRLYSEARPHFEKAAELEPFNTVIWNAPPFRRYGTVESSTSTSAPDGHVGHQH
ncbi:MAG: tetratricopeptide repeat protein [Nitrospirales bacterium]